MMKYLQKLGKALMLPVAALPVCGILMALVTLSLPLLWVLRAQLPVSLTLSVSC